jgi:catechol 2,3-dioxygenase-like lactoylglutathione lyase family enzyme
MMRHMEPRLDLLTLGVPDLDAAHRFYVDGLGWEPALVVEDEVVFIQVGHSRLLALFGADALEEDSGEGPGFGPAAAAPMSLAQNVRSEDEVRAVMASAEAAGATILKPAQRAFWGGFHGYFADPAGFRWEVAYNPNMRVDPDGRVRIGEDNV